MESVIVLLFGWGPHKNGRCFECKTLVFAPRGLSMTSNEVSCLFTTLKPANNETLQVDSSIKTFSRTLQTNARFTGALSRAPENV